MERIVEQGILYDFYGPLLTKHQQEIYEAAVYDNMSLAEIASEFGISRQGVHDLIKRCDKILLDYENKLHLVERFDTSKKALANIKLEITQIQNKDNQLVVENINNSINAIIDNLY